MNLFEVDWELLVPYGSGAYFSIYVDGEKYFEKVSSESENGTFEIYLSGQSHLICFQLNTGGVSGGSPFAKVTRVQYGELDALTEVNWEKNGTGTVEFVDGYLKMTGSSYSYLEALGTLPENQSELPIPFSFNWETSSEFGWDFFEFYIDDILAFKASGLQESVFNSSLTDEEHTLRFRYVKDASYGEYEDLARVWNVNVGGQDWLLDDGWTLGGDVAPMFQEGKIVLACGDDQSSWAERTYIPQEPPVEEEITNVRIKFFRDGIQTNEVTLEALDTFFIDIVIEGFDRVSSEWKPIEPIGIAGVLEEYKEGIFEKIADSLIFEHPEGYYRFLQKCNAPPGTYYLKTTATFGSITQIERLKIKAKVNI